MISNDCPVRSAGITRFLVPSALFLLAGLVGACDDPFKLKAQDENVSQPFIVHALSGSQLSFATALYFPARSVARVDGSFSFDVAFDLNPQGDVVLLPVNVVGQSPTGNRRVGILKAGAVYEAVLEAPKSGYTVDSVTVVKRGETVVVQAQETACSLSLTPYFYVKMVVDSLDIPLRTLFGRVMINSNCGFRSLAPGLPAF